MVHIVKFKMQNVDSEALAVATGTACLIGDIGGHVDIADVECEYTANKSEALLDFVLRLDENQVEQIENIADYIVMEA